MSNQENPNVPGRFWTEKDKKKLRALHAKGLPMQDIALRLGRSVYSVKRYVRRLKLRRNRMLTTEEELALREACERGSTISEIAALFNFKPHDMREKIRNRCLRVRSPARNRGLLVPSPAFDHAAFDHASLDLATLWDRESAALQRQIYGQIRTPRLNAESREAA